MSHEKWQNEFLAMISVIEKYLNSLLQESSASSLSSSSAAATIGTDPAGTSLLDEGLLREIKSLNMTLLEKEIETALGINSWIFFYSILEYP